jgi:hypothetical protein
MKRDPFLGLDFNHDPIHSDHVPSRDHSSTEFGSHFPVYGDASGRHETLGLSPRCTTGPRKILLNPDLFSHPPTQ